MAAEEISTVSRPMGEKKEVLGRLFEYGVDYVLGSTLADIRMLLSYKG